MRREIQLCWKKEGPRWIGSGACNLIVIACRSLVNASRHLRQTTYVGPLHNARDQDGGEGHQPPTLGSHAFTGRYNMLHWNTSSQNAHVMGLQVFWLMALDFLGVWIDHALLTTSLTLLIEKMTSLILQTTMLYSLAIEVHVKKSTWAYQFCLARASFLFICNKNL